MNQNERPDTVHGRLLEAVHLSAYTFERACTELKWLLRQDRWKTVGPGYDDIDTFMATINFSDLRASRLERQDIVRQLAAIKAGQRATARLLGVSQETVARDLGLRDTNVSATTGDPGNAQPELPKTLEITDTNVSLQPYYSDAGITIYHGDCRSLVPLLEPGLMVTDPPYNMGYHYNEYDDALDARAYAALLVDAVRLPLVMIHYPEDICAFVKSFDRVPDKVIAWIYHSMTPRQWRAVAWFGVTPNLRLDSQPYRNPDDKRIQARIARGQHARVYDWWHYEQVKNVSEEKTEHPCQIPTELMRRLLKVTPFNGPVIDPFCGSGTTLVAAQALGRRAIGIESSEEYCEAAANRLRDPSQMELVTS